MIFVNEIAHIVHQIVDFFSGAANKNIGDAFLLVWKYKNGKEKQNVDYITDHKTKEIKIKKTNYVKQRADMSLLSFVKIIGSIKVNRNLEKYRHNERLKERMPNYEVRLGFGLHIGWSIEGAIGSDFKIDASYLSPNVSMSETLECATKLYGTPILLTGHLYEYFTDKTKDECRQIDSVKFKGSDTVYDLYTIDLSLDDLELEEKKEEMKTQIEIKRARLQ